ncbi:hypothetical protein O4215_20665 [Rhodococcus maanshanensis]|uniref:hypothetical protein n=1 Tax=Rhodococcus maanshanensis TaxID=183556 RepID=UPI0022B3A71D|nr:hypothetical protein [Rhodococcus maanshanensis]MCZ4557978.1 hypothetical protein [Rhodococcus maanshanensis]
MTDSKYRAAYDEGKATSRQIGASNPYLPAQPGTVQMRLARCWIAGRTATMPASFNVG